MKQGIHPEYREVVFVDLSNDFKFITRSTVQTKETTKWTDGKTYPLYKLDTSSESHPFFTGKQKLVDTAGRVEKFRQRFGAKTGKTTGVKLQTKATKTSVKVEKPLDKKKTAAKKAQTPETKSASKPSASKTASKTASKSAKKGG